jgi:tRNA modification GTPase
MSSTAHVALLTPPGKSALATLGIIGPRAIAIASQLFRPLVKKMTADDDLGPFYGHFGQDPTDDVVLARRPETSPPIIEVHCHGGPALVEGLIQQVIDQGALRTTWQEFEKLAGRSLIELESLEALSKATSLKASAILLDQYDGALQSAVDKGIQSKTPAILDAALSWSRLGQHLVAPWRVLVYGEPNVGKSSLLNALAGFHRAIVTPHAGTTRDLLAVDVNFDGWPFRLLDGAGIRESFDPIEKEGIDRLKKELPFADLRVAVVDLSRPGSAKSLAELNHVPDLVVGNKQDIADDQTVAVDIRVSATTGYQVDLLIEMIVARLIPAAPAPGQAVPFLPRQIDWIESIRREMTSNDDSSPDVER